MDQSKSSDIKATEQKNNELKKSSADLVPKRSFSLELAVGIFTLIGVAALGYLAIGLGDLRLFSGSEYLVYAEFDNISGLKPGATVEVGGVQVGTVTKLELKDPMARVSMMLQRSFKIKDDDIASIRTKGIIGDRYVKISRGSSDTYIKEGGTVLDTESVVDIEDVIGKLVHSLTSDKDKEKEEDKGTSKTEQKADGDKVSASADS